MEDVPLKERNSQEIHGKSTKNSDYMLVDHEEVFIRQLDATRQELESQISGLRHELEVQWEVLSRLLLFIAPIAITWAVTMFVRLMGNRTLEGYAAAISCGVIVSVLLFDLRGLLQALLQLTLVMQTPQNDTSPSKETPHLDNQDKATSTTQMETEHEEPQETILSENKDSTDEGE